MFIVQYIEAYETTSPSCIEGFKDKKSALNRIKVMTKLKKERWKHGLKGHYEDVLPKTVIDKWYSSKAEIYLHEFN